jgi:CDP-6-deoxy-D-xylo-4-hexulose-3-dehydrase
MVMIINLLTQILDTILKATDLQASIGVAQIDKLESFILKRKQNWKRINNIFSKYNNYFILHKAEENTDPSWFGYAITLKNNIKFSRNDFVKFLNENNIATRLMFGGNLIRQPAYKDRVFEIYNNLDNADIVMNNSFWLGVYPGLSSDMLDYVEDRIDEFINRFS